MNEPHNQDLLSQLEAPTLKPDPGDKVLMGEYDTLAGPDEDSVRSSETQQHDPAFQRFADYEIMGEIARGGMGVVYRARQRSLNRPVALKMILSGRFASDDDVKRFHNEAQAAANLDHPGIVPIYEIGEHHGQHFFSMGLVEGGSLNDLVKNGPLTPHDAAAFMAKTCHAIHFAHERGIIHRDLKPGNILISAATSSVELKNSSHRSRNASTPSSIKNAASDAPDSKIEWIPKVTDFGLAKQMQGTSELTGTGQVLGTPSYMPPEQAEGRLELIGPASDVYSLGAILYFLLTGRPPFQSSSPMETLLQVLTSEPVAPRQLNPSTPRDLETICLKCLEKQPQQRYESAQLLAEDLEAFLKGLPIAAKPVDSYERVLKFAKRQPVVTFATCTIIILISMLLFPLATLDREVLRAIRDTFFRSALWLIILGLFVGVYLVQSVATRIVWQRFFAKRSWRELITDCGWRALLEFTFLVPIAIALIFVIQLIMHLAR